MNGNYGDALAVLLLAGSTEEGGEVKAAASLVQGRTLGVTMIGSFTAAVATPGIITLNAGIALEATVMTVTIITVNAALHINITTACATDNALFFNVITCDTIFVDTVIYSVSSGGGRHWSRYQRRHCFCYQC